MIVAKVLRLSGAIALLTLSACGSVGDPAGFSVVTQDRYDFMSCKEILANRNSQAARKKQLEGLMAKAESETGGFLISGAAYRSEYVQARASEGAAERAMRMHNCEEPKKP